MSPLGPSLAPRPGPRQSRHFLQDQQHLRYHLLWRVPRPPQGHPSCLHEVEKVETKVSNDSDNSINNNNCILHFVRLDNCVFAACTQLL